MSISRLAQWLRMAIALLLIWAAYPWQPAAAESVSFQLTAAEEQNGKFKVALNVLNAVDLYAYEVSLTIDERQLKLTEAASEVAGFSVGPLQKEHSIQFAHTKTGRSPGLNGNHQLHTFVFESLFGTTATVVLDEVRLVDSSLSMRSYRPNLRLELMSNGDISGLADIAGHWAESAIREALARGLITGYPDGKFRPQQQVTRAEFTVMLIRATGLRPEPGIQPAFTDRHAIPAWAAPSITAAAARQWVEGYADGAFHGERPISRLEMAALLVRVLDLQAEAPDTLSYADQEEIAEWGKAYAAAVTETQMMSGRAQQRFAPREPATRAEAAAVILKLSRALNGIID